MLSLGIAARFIRKSPAQSVLIVAGISVGIGILIFLGSLVTSLQSFLITQTLGNSAQIVISNPTRGDPVRFTPRLRRALEEDPRVSAIFPENTISVVFTKDAESAPLTIKGGDPQAMDSIYDVSSHIVEGRFKIDDESIIVGKEFADEFNIDPGDELSLTVLDNQREELEVTGIFSLGERNSDQSLAFSSGELPADYLVNLKNQYSSIEIQVKDVFDSTAVTRKLKQEFPAADISDWQVDQANLLAALTSQTASSVIIQVFVLIAVALGITSTLSISAIQKTRQIGILKALGLSDTRAASIFLWQGLLLGLMGTVGGNLVGVGLIELYERVVGRLDSTLFPIAIDPDFVVLASVMGILVAVVSALAPSRRTAGLDPIKVIQGA